MKRMNLGTSDLSVPEIGLGCMRMAGMTKNDARAMIDKSMELGIDFFDHADIYGKGEAEKAFASAIEPSLREKMILQSKCGIRDGFFDFSKEHIISSVEGSLKRLNTEYLDVLLLHRPDALMEPEEVAEAFTKLENDGKVRHFGVSNHNPMQMELLQETVDQELIVNQVQLSLMQTVMIDHGLNVNMENSSAVNRDGEIIEYSRLNNISLQAWSPFQHGMIEGAFVGNSDFPEINEKLQQVASRYGVTDSAIAIAWILRHPAGIQPIVGTMNKQRLEDIAKASEVKLTREEWYELYRAAGNDLP
ncbi:aldo/keto reductase [Salimicrobium jeotgali]|uniref:Aldo/keto reductase n=1 Tax=Salimicrobium jeotgali TaxID=1230341 RepID=K2GA86_9BACI|nr:aldo/keto reductase [Salimicrobium jeotgali]AKG05649.1 aldo/keto reductase [Salimicrobium jeotgali]EKE31993.1 aldo/keto reductase family protein [Salimicrobium jeotgali]